MRISTPVISPVVECNIREDRTADSNDVSMARVQRTCASNKKRPASPVRHRGGMGGNDSQHR